MARRAPPLSSFAPELKQAWLKAATQTVRVNLKTRQSATALRHRLYKLRVALGEANDPLYESAQYATIRVEPEVDGTWSLILEPADGLYKEALQRAGISVDDLAPVIDFGDFSAGDADDDKGGGR